MKYAVLITACVMLIGSYRTARAATYDIVEGDVDVATTSTVVRPAKGNRLLLVLQNNSDTTVWCMMTTAAAVVGNGTQIFPGASTYDDVVVPSGQVTCIHNGTGTKKVHWKENR
jgi:hypothetical protein